MSKWHGTVPWIVNKINNHPAHIVYSFLIGITLGAVTIANMIEHDYYLLRVEQYSCVIEKTVFKESICYAYRRDR